MNHSLREPGVGMGTDPTASGTQLSGRVAVVTGAGKGLGRAISERLAADGANIILAGRDATALETHARLLDETYPKRESLVTRCDVVAETEVEALIEAAVDRFGGIDILVNAAGIIGPIETPAQDVTTEQFLEVISVNLLGTFLPCRAAIPHLIRRGGGRIVNIAGTSGLRGYKNRVAYSSSKWAVRGLTRTLALELGPYDITVNDVCPNVTHGQRMDTIVNEKARVRGVTPREVYEEYEGQTALGRFIEEADVAAAVSFLVSDGAKNITGHDIVVDAGWDV
jgi:NAD(P)-dependent dehydrogenase (short-subunit alcohol dehydrogenase family)